MTKQANVIIALHFDDVKDKQYQEICKLVVSPDMWSNRNLVSIEACYSYDSMLTKLEMIKGDTDDNE